MILRREHRILVQGVTGKQGTFWTRAMIDYGAAAVGGVNPRKAGTVHLGLPVFASAVEAARKAPFDVALMFIPPAMARQAAFDACEAGARLLVCLTEHIPGHERDGDAGGGSGQRHADRRAEHRRAGDPRGNLRGHPAGVQRQGVPARRRRGDFPFRQPGNLLSLC